MTRWIAFDDRSALSPAARLKVPTEVAAGDALDMLLRSRGPGLALLPGQNGTVQIITVLPWTAARENAAMVADGFLGLTDVPVYEEPEPPKRWWQRIWQSARS